MYQDDWLMRQIAQAIAVLARLLRGEKVQTEELDQAVREVAGMDLDTVDKLPAEALLALLVPGDDRSAERLRTLARLLEASSAPGQARHLKAQKILACLPPAAVTTASGTG
jgi:hypothetical protein